MELTTNRDQPIAVVTNLEHITGLNTARSLQQAGVRVLGLSTSPESPLSRTNCCELIFHQDKNDLIETLLKIGSELDSPCLLFPCSDVYVYLISEHREQLKSLFHVSLPDKNTINTFIDKICFAEYAEQHNLATPASYKIYKNKPLSDQIQEVDYPCLLKPTVKDKQWKRHNPRDKVFKLNNKSELIDKCTEIFGYMSECLVQDWIDGDDGDVYFCLMSYDEQSKCIAAWTGRKIRQWPSLTGSTASAEPVNNDFVMSESRRLFDSVAYKGLGSVEFKYCKRRKKYFITEPTVGRPNLQSRIAVVNGCNLPALLLKTYHPDFTFNQDNDRPCKWINEWSELYSSKYYRRAGELTLYEWFKSLKGDKSYALFSATDMKPFYFYLLKNLKAKFSTLLKSHD